MRRRDFLQILALGLVDAGLGNLWGCTPVKKYSDGGGKKGKVVYCLARPDKKSTTLRVLDWDTYRHEDFFIPLGLPHSLIRDRSDPNIVFLFETMGSCVRTNLTTKELVKIDHAEARDMFNGHGIQTNSGEFLLCSQIDANLKDAIVTIRDAKTLRKVADTPKECSQTHQVVQLPHTNIAVCGNCSTPDRKLGGGITFFDYEKRQVVQRINFEHPVLHLLPISSSEVIGVAFAAKQLTEETAPKLSYNFSSPQNIAAYATAAGNFFQPSPLYYANIDGTQKVVWDESQKNLFHYGFGLGNVPQSHSFLSSHRGSNCIILWKDFKIVKIFPMTEPTNIVVSSDGSEFIVAGDGKLKVFSLQTLTEIKTISDEHHVVMLSAYPTIS